MPELTNAKVGTLEDHPEIDGQFVQDIIKHHAPKICQEVINASLLGRDAQQCHLTMHGIISDAVTMMVAAAIQGSDASLQTVVDGTLSAFHKTLMGRLKDQGIG